jgi:8-oxo-dGTP diphosphatase
MQFIFTADVAITRQGITGRELLLIRRGNAPEKGKWALPGGRVNIDETSLQAAVREVHEETNLVIQPDHLELLCVLDKVDRDPRGRVISTVYQTSVHIDQVPSADDDAVDCRWWTRPELNAHLHELAFDHAQVVEQF